MTNPSRKPALPIEKWHMNKLTEAGKAVVLQWFEDDFPGQIVEISDDLPPAMGPRPVPVLGHIFRVKKRTIWNHCQAGYWTGGPVGRPAILSSAQKTMMVAFVTKEHEKRTLSTYEGLLVFVEKSLPAE
jgi:hypothetical protein